MLPPSPSGAGRPACCRSDSRAGVAGRWGAPAGALVRVPLGSVTCGFWLSQQDTPLSRLGGSDPERPSPRCEGAWTPAPGAEGGGCRRCAPPRALSLRRCRCSRVHLPPAPAPGSWRQPGAFQASAFPRGNGFSGISFPSVFKIKFSLRGK